MSSNVLIVVDRDEKGQTTFKRSYMSEGNFELKRSTEGHIGFTIPKEVTINDVTDTCVANGALTQQCIAIKAKNEELSVAKPAFILTKKIADDYSVDSYELYYTITENGGLTVATDSIELTDGVLIQDEKEAAKSKEPVEESDFWSKLRKLARGGVEPTAVQPDKKIELENTIQMLKTQLASAKEENEKIMPLLKSASDKDKDKDNTELINKLLQHNEKLQTKLDAKKDALLPFDENVEDEINELTREVAELKQLLEKQNKLNEELQVSNPNVTQSSQTEESISINASNDENQARERIKMGINDIETRFASEIEEYRKTILELELRLKEATNKEEIEKTKREAETQSEQPDSPRKQELEEAKKELDEMKIKVDALEKEKSLIEIKSKDDILKLELANTSLKEDITALATKLTELVGPDVVAAASESGASVLSNASSLVSPDKSNDFIQLINEIESIKIDGESKVEIKGGLAASKESIQKVSKFVYVEQPIFYKLNALTSENYNKLFENTDNQRFMKDYLKVVMIDVELISNTSKSTDNDYGEYIKNANQFIYDQLKLDDTVHNKIFEAMLTPLSIKTPVCHILRMVGFINEAIQNEFTKKENINSKIMNAYIERYMQLITENMEEYSDKRQNYNTELFKSFQDAVDKLIHEQDQSKLLSYLKISNHTTSNLDQHSYRYELNFDDMKTPTFLKLGYNDSVSSLYDTTVHAPKANREAITSEPYILGKFNRILLPYKGAVSTGEMSGGAFDKKRNENDADEIRDDILNNLKDGRPIFMIGYGMSGSGKTTSLIYSNEDEEDGILIHLLKKIVGANTIMVTCKEFGIDKKDEDKSEFKLINTEFVNIDNNNETIAQHIAKNIRGSSQEQGGSRRVFATPNNPVSSRSHVVIHILVKNVGGEVIANLFVGDFAGVENRFIKDFKTACMFQKLYAKKPIMKLNPTELKEVAEEQAELDKYNNAEFVNSISRYAKLKELFDRIKEHSEEDIAKVTSLLENSGDFKTKALPRLIKIDVTTNKDAIDKETERLKLTQVKPQVKLKARKTQRKPSDRAALRDEEQERIKEDNKKLAAALKNAKAQTDTRQRQGDRNNKTKKKSTGGGPDDDKYIGILRDILGVRGQDNNAVVSVLFGNSKDDAANVRDAPAALLQKITEYKTKLDKNYKRIVDGLNKKLVEESKIEISTPITYSELKALSEELDKYVPHLEAMKFIDDRNEEGEFINNSLEELRADVQNILGKRNSKCIYYAPAIDPDCIEQYCPALNNCFSSSIDNEEYKHSEIMNWVIDTYEKINKSQSFEEKCVLSVFCVLNVTPGENDPPVMPYINTDKFERILINMQDAKTIEVNENTGVVELVEIDITAPKQIKAIDTLIKNIEYAWNSDIVFPFTSNDAGEKANYSLCLSLINGVDSYLDNEENEENEEKFMEAFKNIFEDFTKITNNKDQTEEEVAQIKQISVQLEQLQKDMNDAVKKESKKPIQKIISAPEMKAVQTNNVELLKTEFKSIQSLIEKQLPKGGPPIERVALINLSTCEEYSELERAIGGDFGNNVSISIDIDLDVIWNVRTLADAFLIEMHKYNASTDIGTIKYLDNFAKSDTTNLICIQPTNKYNVPYSNAMNEGHKALKINNKHL